MEHKASNTVKAICPLCKLEVEVTVDWEALNFIPFRPAERIVRDRISFGKRRKPKLASSTTTPVPSRSVPVQRTDRYVEEDATEIDRRPQSKRKVENPRFSKDAGD